MTKAVLPLILMVPLLAAGCSGGPGTSDGAAEFTRATDGQVTRLIEGELGGETDAGGERVRDVICVEGLRPKGKTDCTIQYVADTPAFSPEEELLRAQRPIWKALFSDPRFRRGRIMVYGPTTDAGGKEDVSQVMLVVCDREAHRQIDWDNVDGDGIKAICEYTPRVSFD